MPEDIDTDLQLPGHTWQSLKDNVIAAGGFPVVAFVLDEQKKITGTGKSLTDSQQYEEYIKELLRVEKGQKRPVFRIVGAQRTAPPVG